VTIKPKARSIGEIFLMVTECCLAAPSLRRRGPKARGAH
jgi:hypothetical protein